MGSIGNIVGGLVIVLIGVILSKYIQPNFEGDWPTILSYGAYITGAVSVFIGISQLSGGKNKKSSKENEME